MATIQKRGKSWRVLVRRKNLPTITRTFDTRREAEQFAVGLEADILSGKYVPAKHCDTLAEALATYESKITSAKKGVAQERRVIAQWQKSTLAGKRLDEITPKDIATWRDAALKKNSPATVRLKLALISNLYTVAVKEWGVSASNPVTQIALPEVRNSRSRRLRAGEYRRLCPELKRMHPELHPFVRLAIDTSMRRSELVALTAEQVDLDGQVATLVDTKNGERREVPLTRRAVRILRSLGVEKGRYFSVGAHTMTVYFRTACQRAGIKDLRLHDMRHEGTSRLFEQKGLNTMEVASITGHKDLRMLKRYTHLSARVLAKKLR